MLYHKESNSIIYEGEDAQLAAPHAYGAQGNYCLVKATYDNLLKLNELDLDVPDPMSSYDWPAQPGTEPFDTQRQVASFMVLNPRAFVVSDLRTGKTRASLWASDWLMSHAKNKLRCLVLSDIAALEDTWAVEITTHFLGKRRYEMLYGSAEAREKALDREADFYLLNHDALRIGRPRRIIQKDGSGRPVVRQVEATGLFKALVEKCFDIVIFDEAATYRENTTEMHKCAVAVSRAAPFVYLLTGTPTPNSPLDAYGLKRLCHPTYKLSFKSWKEQVTETDGPFRRKPRENAVRDTDELLSPGIRITQDQCFDPTPLKVLDLETPLSEQQKEHLRELKRELTVMLDTGVEITAVNEAALRTKLIQISCGAVYDEDHEAHLVDAGPRIAAFKEIVAKIPGKILVFAPLTSIIKLLVKELGDIAIAVPDGSKKRKLAAIHEWQQSPAKRVLVSHPGPIARGTDQSCASVIIWYSPTDRSEYFIQANERTNGINQKNNRFIVRCSGHPIEREIYDRLESNKHLQGLVLKLKEMPI